MIILFWLFFVSCLISQSLMDLFSTLLCVGYLIYWFKKDKGQKKFFERTGLEIFWPIWIGIVALGFALNAKLDNYAIVRIIEFKWILIVYCFIEVLRRQNFSKEKLSWFTLPLLVTGILSLFIHFVKPEVARFLWEPADARLGGAFADPMTFAHAYGQFFVFIFGLIVFQWSEIDRKARGILIATIGITGLCVLFTFTRGVWIGCAVACLVVAGMYSWRLLAVFSAAGFVGVGALFAFWGAFRERILFALNASNNYDSQRVALWRANWEMVKDFPMLGTGYGVNTQRLAEYYQRLGYPEDQFKSHAHNQYLHIWAGTGTLGLLCYLFFVGFLLVQTWKNFKSFQGWEKALMAGCMAAQVEFLVSGFTESNFERSKVRFVAMMAWAFVLLYRSYRIRKNA